MPLAGAHIRILSPCHGEFIFAPGQPPSLALASAEGLLSFPPLHPGLGFLTSPRCSFCRKVPRDGPETISPSFVSSEPQGWERGQVGLSVNCPSHHVLATAPGTPGDASLLWPRTANPGSAYSALQSLERAVTLVPIKRDIIRFQ